MDARKLIEALSVAERLKDATRHCYTKNGRHESVAEHSWMMTLTHSKRQKKTKKQRKIC